MFLLIGQFYIIWDSTLSFQYTCDLLTKTFYVKFSAQSIVSTNKEKGRFQMKIRNRERMSRLNNTNAQTHKKTE